MAHDIDISTGRPAIAFRGPVDDIWHRLGTMKADGRDAHQWAADAGLDWTAEKVPALADCSGLGNLPWHCRMKVDGSRFLVRSDNGHVLGHVSDRYQPVQPADVLDWFDRYIACDDRFELDVAGALKSGEIIWATATYRDGMEVAGDRHIPRLLMTTTFDGTGSTINRATMTRVVCNNTLDCALADRQASIVRTRHSTKFDAARVGQELGRIARGFTAYKAMGEAMAGAKVTGEVVGRLFKHVLDIPFDCKKEDISARKLNQFDDLRAAYAATARETEANTAWAALNAVTRYVDHTKSCRGTGQDATGNRFHSAQFGTGAQMKAQAVAYLTETCEINDSTWEKSILAAPFKPASERV
jgi:phage/plasmid-like protein (TIGR03299 family)